MKHWTEEMADKMGQIVFRLETNFFALKREFGFGLPYPELEKAITDDIEELKEIKAALEAAEG